MISPTHLMIGYPFTCINPYTSSISTEVNFNLHFEITLSIVMSSCWYTHIKSMQNCKDFEMNICNHVGPTYRLKLFLVNSNFLQIIEGKQVMKKLSSILYLHMIS